MRMRASQSRMNLGLLKREYPDLEWEKREKLGEILLAEGVITVEDLQQALRKQKETKMRLGEVLISLGLISEEKLIHYIAEQLGIQNMPLERLFIADEVLSLLDEDFIRENEVMPLFVEGGSLHCAMVDPLDTDVIEEIESKTGLSVEVSICSRKQMVMCTALHFPGSEGMDGVNNGNGYLEAGRFLKRLLTKTGEERCSELHLERVKEKVSVRVGWAGKIKPVNVDSLNITGDILAAARMFLEINTTDEGSHQESEQICRLQLGSEEFSSRVSLLSTILGESMAMRLVRRNLYTDGLSGLGVSEGEKQQYSELLSHGRGLILVASPPGNGKTVTMYAMLKHLAESGKTIYLLEESPLDILEYTNQVHTRRAEVKDLNIWLSSVMKHSPDVVAVGECNDKQTLLSLLYGPASSTLVISTIVASDFSDAWSRLYSITEDTRMLSKNLLGIASQRMLRSSHSPTPVFQVVKLNDEMRTALENYSGGTGTDAFDSITNSP